MLHCLYHLRLVLSLKRDHGQMPAITAHKATASTTRTSSLESGGAWFCEWSEWTVYH